MGPVVSSNVAQGPTTTVTYYRKKKKQKISLSPDGTGGGRRGLRRQRDVIMSENSAISAEWMF